jgi:hypothetical protein
MNQRAGPHEARLKRAAPTVLPVRCAIRAMDSDKATSLASCHQRFFHFEETTMNQIQTSQALPAWRADRTAPDAAVPV